MSDQRIIPTGSVPKPGWVRVTIDMPADLRKRIKRIAAERECGMRDVMVPWLEKGAAAEEKRLGL